MAGPSFDALRSFFDTSPAARKATRPLAREAMVGLDLSGGPAHFTMAGGAAKVMDGPAPDPDFTLSLPDAAVKRITSLQSDDVGEFGIEFFKLVLAQAPEEKVRIHVQASTPRLLGRGYLGVLALGGMRITFWLLKNGVKNPRAAIDRLRGR
jgi:hypothetical protein